MARRDDTRLEESTTPAVAAATTSNDAPLAGCTCQDFRRNQVCDHVLMAAAVRMVHRMIDIEKDAKPH